jgi:hypothetical protein
MLQFNLKSLQEEYRVTFNDGNYFCSVGNTFTILLVRLTVKFKHDNLKVKINYCTSRILT